MRPARRASAQVSRLDERNATINNGIGASQAAHHCGVSPVATYSSAPPSRAAAIRAAPARVSAIHIEPSVLACMALELDLLRTIAHRVLLGLLHIAANFLVAAVGASFHFTEREQVAPILRLHDAAI